MQMRDEGWSVGAVARPTIHADPVEPMRTVYQVRDERVVPLVDERQDARAGRRRHGLVQGLLEFGDGLAGFGWGLLRLPFYVGVGVGILGVVVMAFMWAVTQSPGAIRYGLWSVGLIVASYAVQFITFKIQAAVTRWVAKGAR